MSQKEKLLKIKSELILKSIFAYINYNHILKLIKNNKKIQRKLGIDIQNYKKKSSYKFIERKIITKNDVLNHMAFKIVYIYVVSILITLIFFVIALIFAILFTVRGFNDNNTKPNYNKKFFNIIKKINISLFGPVAYIIVSYYIIFIWAIKTCYLDYGKKLILKKCSLIVTAFIYVIFDVFIIIKLYLSYKIKKSEITWFMICDYFLIFLIPLYLIGIIYTIYRYFVDAGKGKLSSQKNIYILKQFQNINIEDFELPNNFEEKNNDEKRLYIFNNKKKYKIKPSYVHILKLINEFRRKNNIDELTFETESFSKLVINEYSEIILFKNKSIFKISKWKYLFVNPVNKFENKIKNRNQDLINILLNKNLNAIQIYKQDNTEFIYIYKKYKNSNLNPIKNIKSTNFEDIPSSRKLNSKNNPENDILTTNSYEDIYYEE